MAKLYNIFTIYKSLPWKRYHQNSIENLGKPDPKTPSAKIPSDQLPKCTKCGGLLRPAVIWFGENLDSNVMRKAAAELEKCDICLVIGTSSVVYPAAMFAPQVSSVIKTEWNDIMHLGNAHWKFWLISVRFGVYS